MKLSHVKFPHVIVLYFYYCKSACDVLDFTMATITSSTRNMIHLLEASPIAEHQESIKCGYQQQSGLQKAHITYRTQHSLTLSLIQFLLVCIWKKKSMQYST